MNTMAPGCEVEEWVACEGGANVQQTDVIIKSSSLEKIDDPLWNKGFKGAPEARIQQTVEGAQIRWEMDGQYPFFLSAERAGSIVGQLYLHRGFVHPDLMQWARPMLKTRYLHRLWGVMSWFGGPVIFAREYYEEILRAFLAEIDVIVERYGIAAVKDATPSFYGEDIDWDLVDSIYEDFAYEKSSKATIVLDVRSDLEELWAGLSKEARQKVRKAERQGIEIVEDNTCDGLNRYYAVRLENARRNGLRPPSKESILAAEPIYMQRGLSKLFLAQHEGHTVAGQLLVVFNGNVQLAGICYSDRARELRLSVNDLLQWEVVKWAHAEGHNRVDWSGFTPDPQTEKEVGINRFKEKWGGQVVHYHTYNKILAPRRFAALNWVKKQARKFNVR